jgi:hypothetical protein
VPALDAAAVAGQAEQASGHHRPRQATRADEATLVLPDLEDEATQTQQATGYAQLTPGYIQGVNERNPHSSLSTARPAGTGMALSALQVRVSFTPLMLGLTQLKMKYPQCPYN